MVPWAGWIDRQHWFPLEEVEQPQGVERFLVPGGHLDVGFSRNRERERETFITK